jgi:hypothetical protein
MQSYANIRRPNVQAVAPIMPDAMPDGFVASTPSRTIHLSFTMQWILVLLALTAFWVLSNIWTLAKNFLAARNSGFPPYITPSNPSNPLWMISQVSLTNLRKPTSCCCIRADQHLHLWLGVSRAIYDPAKYGATFICATPSACEL